MHSHAYDTLTYNTPHLRRRLITMIHKSIAFSDNITKITTLIELFSYLQIITIANKLLTPIVTIHLYMPTHEGDHKRSPNFEI